MGFLDRAIKKGISNAVQKAVGNAVQQAVEPKATELANKAADSLDKTVRQNSSQREQTQHSYSSFESAMANLQRSAESYATEAAKNVKICPSCDEAVSAEKKFCPKCGTQLPEHTVAQAAVCTNCGKQNTIGTKFCSDCGSKLPAAIEEEQQMAAKNAAVMAEWDAKLPAYPKWCCGGTDFSIEEYDSNYIIFTPNFLGENNKAHIAIREYRELLLQNGFKQAGEYPSADHLYKKINGICYHVDTEHCFDGDPDCPSIGFNISEPIGGFEYVKPEPKKKTSFFDLFK